MKGLVFALLAAPLLWALVAVAMELQSPGSALGADPGEALVLLFGEWGLRFTLLALLLSTLQRRTPLKTVRFRRMTGLFAFTYASLHLLSYAGFLAGFSLQGILEDLTERTYITVGFAAWLILLALAVTSTRGWQRRLQRRWQRLHRGVYLAVGLALAHLWWLTREDYTEVFVYSAIFAMLLIERIVGARRA